MLDSILIYDRWLFYAINFGWKNPIFDLIMPIITKELNWLPIYIISLGLLLWKGGKTGRICVFMLLITVVITDQLNSSILKELFHRIRPCHVLNNVHLLVQCGGGKSFPSSHACNNFGAFVILTYFYKKYIWYFFIIASLVSFSRIYVGVHYPLDILGGMFIGSILALIIIKLFKIMKIV